MTSLGFSSDPHVQYLAQILEEIAQGRLKIPRFQRPLVWGWDRRLDLLRSIRRGIPMGAVMVWRTNTSPIHCYSGFGRFRFKSPSSHAANQYILDGVQRLTTLYSALFDEDVGVVAAQDEEDDVRSAYFDLEDEDFVAIPPEKVMPNRHLRLSLLLDSVRLLRFQRHLSGEPDRKLQLADEIAKAFREYKIPVIPIVTDDLSLASLTFQKINSSGVAMSEVHMLHALTWSNEFNLLERLEQLRQEMRSQGWDEIDDDLLIRMIKAALDCDVYRAKEDEVSRRLRQRPLVMSEVSQALSRTSEFFWSEFGIGSPDMVPYAFQILIISEVLRLTSGDLASEMRDAVVRWFWITTYLEYFTGLSGDKVTDEIVRLQSAARNSDATFVDDPRYKIDVLQWRSRFDARTARSKATLLLLAERFGAETDRKEGFRLLKQHGRQLAAPVFSRADLNDVDPAYSSPGNRFLVTREETKAFRSILVGGEFDQRFAARHCISMARAGLFPMAPIELVLDRTQLLQKLEEQKLLSSIKHRVSNGKIARG